MFAVTCDNTMVLVIGLRLQYGDLERHTGLVVATLQSPDVPSPRWHARASEAAVRKPF